MIGIIFYATCDNSTHHIDWWINGLVQEICNSIAKALELPHSCTNPSKLGKIWMNIYDTSAISTPHIDQ